MKQGTTSSGRLERRFALCAMALAIAGCGGGGGGGGADPAALAAMAALAGAGQPPAAGISPAIAPAILPSAPPQVLVKCTIDMAVAPTYEEMRLPNKLAPSDALSFSAQLLKASAFDKFGSNFAATLCSNGTSGASSYDEAATLLKAEGQKLWKAALDRVQGRKVEGTLPQSDDRMLYWARLTMTLALRQWKPDFALSPEQRAALELVFEKASRGQDSIDFPEGPKYKRILVSGFDPFTLGQPGGDWQLSIRIGNPSGATILSLDGNTVALADGTTAVIRTFILPVNYGPFIAGMQEDTLGPWFKSGAKRVDASITVSQGRNQFDLELYNGRYHMSSAGNDNVMPACSDRGGFPASLDCDIHPPERWLGYASKPWQRDAPPQFTSASLPFQKMIDANTGAGILNPETNAMSGWAVALHGEYSVRACTKTASDMNDAYEANARAKNALYDRYFAAPAGSQEETDVLIALSALPSVPRPNPQEMNCANTGGGGSYLSNASAYRNTLMRDTFRLDIPAGHIHTPIMTTFGEGSDDKITDATFEERRRTIVAQSRSLIVALAKSLAAQ